VGSIFTVEGAANASDEFKDILDQQVSMEYVTKLKDAMKKNPDVVIKDGKRGSVMVYSEEIGPMGMKVHLTMNPHWQNDLLEAVTPMRDEDMSPCKPRK
jgi:hypothetical protein